MICAHQNDSLTTAGTGEQLMSFPLTVWQDRCLIAQYHPDPPVQGQLQLTDLIKEKTGKVHITSSH